MPCVIVPHLMGGLGNWLFQVAFSLNVSHDCGYTHAITPQHCSRSPHSETDYFSTILKNFNKLNSVKFNMATVTFREHEKLSILTQESMRAMFANKSNIKILCIGYFQNYNYIPKIFRNILSLPDIDDSKVKNRCVIHIRGGDYVNNSLHHVNLEDYYRKSIQHMKDLEITKFSVFTNDKPYATSKEFLRDIDYEFVDAPELESLTLMSKCKAGITANSTFSWWGAYLNPNRPICMPSKWFNDPEYFIAGYFFPGVFIISV